MELELGQPILLFGSIPVSQSGMTELSFSETGPSRGRSGADLESSDTLMGECDSLIVQDPRLVSYRGAILIAGHLVRWFVKKDMPKIQPTRVLTTYRIRIIKTLFMHTYALA